MIYLVLDGDGQPYSAAETEEIAEAIVKEDTESGQESGLWIMKIRHYTDVKDI